MWECSTSPAGAILDRRGRASIDVSRSQGCSPVGWSPLPDAISVASGSWEGDHHRLWSGCSCGEFDAGDDVVGVYGVQFDVECGHEAGGRDAVAMCGAHGRAGEGVAGDEPVGGVPADSEGSCCCGQVNGDR